MSFFKSLMLAIVATLFLTYVLGASVIDFFGVDVYMDDELIEPIKAISFSALAVVVLVVVALGIVLSVFGTMIFFVMMILGGVAMFAIGVFWPVLLMALVLWLLTREKSQHPA